MSYDHARKRARRVRLRVFHRDGQYHSMEAGRTVEAKIRIRRSVEVEDEGGVFTRRSMASLASGLVIPHQDDCIEVDGERWTVEGVESDDGNMLRLWVRPALK